MSVCHSDRQEFWSPPSVGAFIFWWQHWLELRWSRFGVSNISGVRHISSGVNIGWIWSGVHHLLAGVSGQCGKHESPQQQCDTARNMSGNSAVLTSSAGQLKMPCSTVLGGLRWPERPTEVAGQLHRLTDGGH